MWQVMPFKKTTVQFDETYPRRWVVVTTLLCMLNLFSYAQATESIVEKITNETMFEKNATEIHAVITNYFEGIFYGDVDKLESSFHPQCLLYGDIDGQVYFKPLQEYLTAVKSRKSPSASGEEFKMKVLSVEILNHVAYVKLHCPMLGYNYYDFIAMSKIGDKWVIVNKLFSNEKQ